MVKKRFFIFGVVVFFTAMHVNAQSLLSGVKYDVSVGFGTCTSNAPFDMGKMGFNMGVDAIKPIKSFVNDKVDIYGLLGLHFVQKGGKQSNSLEDLLEVNNSFTVNQLSIPIHAGARYNFKKCSLYLDFGPYIAFGIGGSNDVKDLERKVMDLGVGLDFGIKFKRFGISLGYDKGFTNIAQYTITSSNFESNYEGLFEIGEQCNMKGNTAYMTFRWTLGRSK